MYDDLMEKDPKIQKLLAEREAKGEARGEARGEAKGEAKVINAVRAMVVEMVQIQFPPLAELAQKRMNQLDTIEKLHELFRQVNMVDDEQEARIILSNPIP